MKRVALAALIALAPIAAPAASIEQQKKEMQEDACWAWERARGGRYHPDIEKIDLSYLKGALEEDGWTKYDYTLDRRVEMDRLQQVCERYFDRFGEWPERCCATAPLLYGTAAPGAKDQGRKDRRARIKRLLAEGEANRPHPPLP